MATLLFDLLTMEEETNRANVFDIPLLAGQVVDAVLSIGIRRYIAWRSVCSERASVPLPRSCRFAVRPAHRRCRMPRRATGSPGAVVDRIEAPRLLIVREADYDVIELNEQALARLSGPRALEIVRGASHLFPEPGSLEMVIEPSQALVRALSWDEFERRELT